MVSSRAFITLRLLCAAGVEIVAAHPEVEGCFCCSLLYLGDTAALGEKKHKEGKVFYLVIIIIPSKLIAGRKKKKIKNKYKQTKPPKQNKSKREVKLLKKQTFLAGSEPD